MGFRLYLQPKIGDDYFTWWRNFELSVSTSDDRKTVILNRNQALDFANAVLKYDTESFLPYLLFTNKEDAAMFLLKWS